MAFKNINIIVLKALIRGLLWGVFYYYIRKGLNPANYGKERQDIERKQELGLGTKQEFYGDAIYGGIAIGLIYVFDKITNKILGI